MGQIPVDFSTETSNSIMPCFRLLECECTPTTHIIDSLPADSSIVDTILKRSTVDLFRVLSPIAYVFSSPFLFLRDVFFFILAAYRSLHWLFQIIILTILYVKIARNYQNYLNLGRGGTSPTFAGFLRVTRLRAYGGLWDVFQPPSVPPLMHPYRGKLDASTLPQREGERPKVGGVAPQRQLDQKTLPSIFQTLLTMFERKQKQFPDALEMRQSFLEGHTTALFAAPSQWTHNRPTIHEFGYEISHPHRNDGSLHMILHPEDIVTVIEKRWGERHPLARGSWYWRFSHFMWRRKRTDPRPSRPPVPEYMCFIYAPRNQEEIVVVEKLLDAAAWFSTGVDFDNGGRTEDTLDNLPAPPSPTPKKEWSEMSRGERLSHLLDFLAETLDKFLEVFWKWVVIRLGSVVFVVWIMDLHIVLQSFVFSYWSWILYHFRLGL